MKRYLDVFNNRLVYVGCKANREMWEERWENIDIEKLFKPRKLCATEKSVVDITRKYLPEGSRILEGGCGLGNNVYLIQRSGYEVIGVDYAEKTIKKMISLIPSLDLRCGDLESLQFDNDYFDGYWSFGVVEHFYGGYEKIVKEMFRVLKSGGYLFVTVPAFSKLRRIKASLGFFSLFCKEDVDMNTFYQFAFSPEDVNKIFSENGFEPLEHIGFNVNQGVSDEIPCTRLVMSLLSRILCGILERALRNFCNHMYIFVFRKRESL